MAKADPTHRIVIAESEISDLLETLDWIEKEHGLTKALTNFNSKLIILKTKISIGAATPAYIKSGVKEASRLSIENLEAMEESVVITQTKQVSPTTIGISEDAMFAELERQEKEMLAEMAAQGNQNVILHERRQQPRDDGITDNTDNTDIFNALCHNNPQ